MRIFDEFMNEIEIDENVDIKALIRHDAPFILIEKGEEACHISREFGLGRGLNIWDVDCQRYIPEMKVYWLDEVCERFYEVIEQ